MIIETDSKCNVCGWELFANTWVENHGFCVYETMSEYYCRNGCEFDLEKEYSENEED